MQQNQQICNETLKEVTNLKYTYLALPSIATVHEKANNYVHIK